MSKVFKPISVIPPRIVSGRFRDAPSGWRRRWKEPRWMRCTGRCRANMAHIRQSRPDSGLGSQAKVPKPCKLFPHRSEAVSASSLPGFKPTTLKTLHAELQIPRQVFDQRPSPCFCFCPCEGVHLGGGGGGCESQGLRPGRDHPLL
jgi:hypothetical protein